MGGMDIRVCTEVPVAGELRTTNLRTADLGFQTIIPFIPTTAPQLGHLVYEMILGHFLSHDKLVSIHEYALHFMIFIYAIAGLTSNDQGMAKLYI